MKVIAFYSYKGGTGRSLALAQLAFALSWFGKTVCVLDFDLEAPGTSHKLNLLLDSEALSELLDAASQNHAIIANNLANLNTPGYTTARLRFVRQLQAVLDERGDLRPGKHLETEVYRPFFGDAGPDGNNVALAREIVELNKNALKMRLYLAVLGSRIRRLRAAIDGR